jgi:hypothetical protein
LKDKPIDKVNNGLGRPIAAVDDSNFVDEAAPKNVEKNLPDKVRAKETPKNNSVER